MKILGDLEQKIMDCLWASDRALKCSEVQECLGEKFAYTTIMTVMKRLSEKEILVRAKEANYFVYSPAKERAEFANNKLTGFFKQLLNSYGDLAISRFVDAVKADKDDIKVLKKYLEDQE